MSTIDVNKKYQNFQSPKTITVNNEDLFEKYEIKAKGVFVEETENTLTAFSIRIDDPKLAWINTGLFELNKVVAIKMGYPNTLEELSTEEITAVKSIAPSSGSPQIRSSAKQKNKSKVAANNPPLPLPTYGSTLLSFTSTETVQENNRKICCSAECLGLPEVKTGVIVTLAGLRSRFTKNYVLEKTVHSWG